MSKITEKPMQDPNYAYVSEDIADKLRAIINGKEYLKARESAGGDRLKDFERRITLSIQHIKDAAAEGKVDKKKLNEFHAEIDEAIRGYSDFAEYNKKRPSTVRDQAEQVAKELEQVKKFANDKRGFKDYTQQYAESEYDTLKKIEFIELDKKGEKFKVQAAPHKALKMKLTPAEALERIQIVAMYAHKLTNNNGNMSADWKGNKVVDNAISAFAKAAKDMVFVDKKNMDGVSNPEGVIRTNLDKDGKLRLDENGQPMRPPVDVFKEKLSAAIDTVSTVYPENAPQQIRAKALILRDLQQLQLDLNYSGSLVAEIFVQPEQEKIPERSTPAPEAPGDQKKTVMELLKSAGVDVADLPKLAMSDTIGDVAPKAGAVAVKKSGITPGAA